MAEESANKASQTPSPRLFTVQQATRSLPLVSRIVQDVLQSSREVRDLQEELDSLESQGLSSQSDHCLKRLKKARDAYKKYCTELAVLGCSLADKEAGAVEFPAVIAGRQVALSWKPDEPEVAFWHDFGQETSTRRSLKELTFESEERLSPDRS